jgi:hypothetical protein
MSTTDKTGDKLVQSIRKTKAGEGGTRRRTGSQGAATGGGKAKPAAKPASKRGAKPASPKAVTAKAKAVVDPYRSCERVWPD